MIFCLFVTEIRATDMMIIALFDTLFLQENIVEDTIDVPVKWHKNFVARRGEMLTQIAADYGGVSVSFPKNGSSSEVVKLSGAKDCVMGAKQRIVEIVEDLESLVTIDCVIPQKYHRQVMGAKGSNVQEVTKQYNVTIKFPERPQQQDRDNKSPASVSYYLYIQLLFQ